MIEESPDVPRFPPVPNDSWRPASTRPGRWCRRSWCSIPRRHQSQDFVRFDPALPSYYRCSRCGAQAYALNAARGITFP